MPSRARASWPTRATPSFFLRRVPRSTCSRTTKSVGMRSALPSIGSRGATNDGSRARTNTGRLVRPHAHEDGERFDCAHDDERRAGDRNDGVAPRRRAHHDPLLLVGLRVRSRRVSLHVLHASADVVVRRDRVPHRRRGRRLPALARPVVVHDAGRAHRAHAGAPPGVRDDGRRIQPVACVRPGPIPALRAREARPRSRGRRHLRPQRPPAMDDQRRRGCSS